VVIRASQVAGAHQHTAAAIGAERIEQRLDCARRSSRAARCGPHTKRRSSGPCRALPPTSGGTIPPSNSQDHRSSCNGLVGTQFSQPTSVRSRADRQPGVRRSIGLIGVGGRCSITYDGRPVAYCQREKPCFWPHKQPTPRRAAPSPAEPAAAMSARSETGPPRPAASTSAIIQDRPRHRRRWRRGRVLSACSPSRRAHHCTPCPA
jgi:hypothetical protein